MSDRTRGSRSRGEPDSNRSSGRSPGRSSGGAGDAWRSSSWDEADDDGYADDGRSSGRARYSSQASSQGRRSRRYDDYDETYAAEPDDYQDYDDRRPRSSRSAAAPGSARNDRALAPLGNDGRGPRAGGGYEARQRQARRGAGSRTPVVILAVLLVVIALAVIGILVVPGHVAKQTVVIPDSPFATFTPGPTPTVDPNFKAFSSTRSKYAVVYPQAWNATSDQRTTQSEYDYIDTFALQNAPSRLVVEQAGAFSSYTDAQIIANEVSNAQQNGVTFTRTDNQTPTPKTPTAQTTQTPGTQTATQQVGGATWTRQDYSVNANGNPVHMVILACHHSGRGYVIVLVSTAAEFGNDDQAVFEPMLGSFTFL